SAPRRKQRVRTNEGRRYRAYNGRRSFLEGASREASMFGSSSKPSPDCWEPTVGGAAAEPLVPRLIAMFGLRTCWFESFPFDVQLPRIEPGRIVLPADEPGVPSWSFDIGVELPVRCSGLTLGRYVLVP